MKLLVIALAGIGDALMAEPMIRHLRQTYTGAELECLVMWAGAKSLLETNPAIDRIHQYNLLEAGTLPSLRYLFGLRRNHYQLTVLAAPQARMQYRAVQAILGGRAVFHTYGRRGSFDYNQHIVDNNLHLVGGAPCGGPRIHFQEEPPDRPGSGGRQRLGMHVGSGTTKNLALRRWPGAHYLKLAEIVSREHPHLEVLLFGGPSELEVVSEIETALAGRNVRAVKEKSILGAARRIAGCDLFLSVDSALMHVADAVGVPHQFVIETPTLNKTVLPYSGRAIVVKNPTLIGAESIYRYGAGGIRATRKQMEAIMSAVRPEDVYAAMRPVLTQNPT